MFIKHPSGWLKDARYLDQENNNQLYNSKGTYNGNNTSQTRKSDYEILHALKEGITN